LSNAFKYTKAGSVTLAVSCEGGKEGMEMVIAVTDTGIGIKPEDVEVIFSDFEQAEGTVYHHFEGAGLGLSITKNLVELMEGGISVESVYGKGSTFTVSLPQGYLSDEVIGGEVAKNLKELNYSNNRSTGKSKPTRIKLPNARVLVVDDNVTNLDVAKGAMKPYQMQVDCATGGAQAIEAIKKERVHYHAIFMDHMMPGIDGMEATRIIRKDVGTEYAQNIPIIALTANVVAGNEKIFLENGFQAFLPKPINLMMLDKVVHKFIAPQIT
jgi:CheY-like chemotaxis protein